MRDLRTAATAARLSARRWVCIASLVTLAGCLAAWAQSGTPAPYQVYALQHQSAADVEKTLAGMLADFGAEVHLVADARNNKILLRGPEEAQRIAAQLIQSIDRPPVPAVASQSSVQSYVCASDRLVRTAEALKVLYSDRKDVKIAPDAKSSRLIVLAPAEIHATLPGQIATLGDPNASGQSTGPGNTGANGQAIDNTPPEKPIEEFVSLERAAPDQVDRMLRELFGSRLKPQKASTSKESIYTFTDTSRHQAKLTVDRRRNGVLVSAAGPLQIQLVRLVRLLDGPPQPTGATVKIVPLRRADPAKVQQAVEAYRSGYREGLRSQPAPTPSEKQGAMYRSGNRRVSGSADPYRNRQPEGLGPNGRFQDRYVRPVSHLAQLPIAGLMTGQTGQSPGNVPGNAVAPDTAGGGEPDELEQRLRQLGSDLQIEVLPDLDVIILQGPDREVEEVSRIIAELERLSAETEPVIIVHPLQHVGSEAIAGVIAEASEDLIGGRQGRVSVTPLGKPNALLLIGWGEAVDAIRKLIRKLDQPVDPTTQFRVFPLRHAPAATVMTAVQGMFVGRGGLSAEALVSIDARTNSLIVQASPRDMIEVAKLVERLDRVDSEAFARARIFKLENSLAMDLGSVLQAAINAARGGDGGGHSAALELLTVGPEGERILRSGILNEVQITPNPRTNTLVVSGPPESMDLIAELIKQLDSPAAVAQLKVFRITNGDANDLVTMLRTLLPASSGTATGPQLAGAEGETSLVPVRFSVDTRTNSIIAAGSEGDLKIIEALLLRLDEEDSQQRKNTVYRLKNAPAQDVARAISEFLRSERQVQLATPGSLNPFQQIEREVVVVPELVSNSLILSATPRFFDEIMDLIEQLDSEPPQVMIQVLIAEVALGDFDEFGVELGLQDSLLFDRSLLGDIVTTVSSAQQSTAQGIITSTQEIIQSASNTPGFNFNNVSTQNPNLGNSGADQALLGAGTVGSQGLSSFAVGRVNSELGWGGLVLSASSESVSVLIRALQECRRLKILSRPQVMTLDNQPAFIQVGKRVPRITGSTINETGQVNTIALENVGLILGVLPRISPDGMVVMELDAEKSELAPESEGIPVSISEGVVIRSPAVNLTMAQTTVSAADGETIVLGGLITKSTSTTDRRVPYLADIPLLGELFRYESKKETRTELLIILTPHIINSPADAERVKQAEAARMHWCLGDVNSLQGETGIYDADCPENDLSTPVIYPHLNPRGILPESKTPKPGQPPLPEQPTPAPPRSSWPGELSPPSPAPYPIMPNQPMSPPVTPEPAGPPLYPQEPSSPISIEYPGPVSKQPVYQPPTGTMPREGRRFPINNGGQVAPMAYTAPRDPRATQPPPHVAQSIPARLPYVSPGGQQNPNPQQPTMYR